MANKKGKEEEEDWESADVGSIKLVSESDCGARRWHDSERRTLNAPATATKRGPRRWSALSGFRSSPLTLFLCPTLRSLLSGSVSWSMVCVLSSAMNLRPSEPRGA